MILRLNDSLDIEFLYLVESKVELFEGSVDSIWIFFPEGDDYLSLAELYKIFSNSKNFEKIEVIYKNGKKTRLENYNKLYEACIVIPGYNYEELEDNEEIINKISLKID